MWGGMSINHIINMEPIRVIINKQFEYFSENLGFDIDLIKTTYKEAWYDYCIKDDTEYIYILLI